MPIIDNRTAFLNLPLPNIANALVDDQARLEAAINAIDTGVNDRVLKSGSAPMTGALNFAPIVSVASAATTNVGSATSNCVLITGSVTITAFDAAPSGAIRFVQFNGPLNMGHNGTSFILPGSATISTGNGDSAIFESLGSGNWKCLAFFPAGGYALLDRPSLIGPLNFAPPVTLASASTVDIGGAGSNIVIITGTTTITSFASSAYQIGSTRIVKFSGALTLTHNASFIVLPTGANIVTAAGDIAEFINLSNINVWVCIRYLRADGTALVGAPDATKLPISGGTLTGALNFAPTQTIASATTTDLGAATSNEVIISGTVTITGLGTIAAGAMRKVQFSGVLILTHNATSLILQGGANITTAAGDCAEFVSLGGGNWRCMEYVRANGQALYVANTLSAAQNYAATVTIGSAATTDLGAAGSNEIIVSGTATITALGTIAAGAYRAVQFSGACTLTHNATSLILPGGANIVAVAGDCAEFISLGSGNWRCVNYLSANGRVVFASGKTLTVNNSVTIAGTDGTTVTLPPTSSSIGYLGAPQNVQNTAYTLVLADAGQSIVHPSADTTARTYTIPANSSVAFPVGTLITIVNQRSAGVITLAITTDTLVWSPTAATGSRTLAACGIATLYKVGATEWMITGSGLT